MDVARGEPVREGLAGSNRSVARWTRVTRSLMTPLNLKSEGIMSATESSKSLSRLGAIARDVASAAAAEVVRGVAGEG